MKSKTIPFRRRSALVHQASARESALSAEERRLLTLAVSGFTNKEMAGQLHLSQSTISRRLLRICGKLGAKNRFELVLAAVDGDYLI